MNYLSLVDTLYSGLLWGGVRLNERGRPLVGGALLLAPPLGEILRLRGGGVTRSGLLMGDLQTESWYTCMYTYNVKH